MKSETEEVLKIMEETKGQPEERDRRLEELARLIRDDLYDNQQEACK